MPKLSIDFARTAQALGVELDARGLFPLVNARALLDGARTYQRENADLIWGSLLSLEDAPEFVAAASRLEWKFPLLRGWDNQDAVLRFGEGILPWLEQLLEHLKGRVGSMPALPFHFVWTHLVAIGPAAVNAVLRVKKDGDADPDGLGSVSEWLERHGSAAWVALSGAADGGSAEAKRALAALTKRSPRVVARHLKKPARSARPQLTAEAILRVLDAAAASNLGERMPWPSLRPSAGHFEYHAMRVISVRQDKGDHWGVLIEVVQGDLLDRRAEWPAVVQQYTYGSKVAAGGRYLLDARPLKVSAKKLKLDEALATKLDLRPGFSVTGAVEQWPDVLAIRATLERDRASLFPPPAKVLKALKVPKAKVITVTEAFAHVDGPALGKGPLAKLPSTSVAWRTLAEALAARDPARFDAGVPNTDWRQHAKQSQPFAW